MKKFVSLLLCFVISAYCVISVSALVREPTAEEIASAEEEMKKVQNIVKGDVSAWFKDNVPFEDMKNELTAVAKLLYPDESDEDIAKRVDCLEGYQLQGLKVEEADMAKAYAILKTSDLIENVEFNYLIPVPEIIFLGDVNGNGKIDVVDYIMVKRAIVGSYTLDETQKKVADVNRDGNIDTVDFIMIKRHILGTYTVKQPPQ